MIQRLYSDVLCGVWSDDLDIDVVCVDDAALERHNVINRIVAKKIDCLATTNLS